MNAPQITLPHTSIARCEHRLLKENVHEFVFRENSHEAIDEWITMTEGLIQANEPIASFVQIIDTTFLNDVPMVYAYNRIKPLSLQYSNVQHWYTAFVHSQGALIFVANTFINLLRLPMTTKFFARNEKQKAIDWLLAQAQ